MKSSYDYVIVGGGSAGCVLAARLSENPAAQVALIEAGPMDDAPEVHTLVAFPQLLKSDHDWDYSPPIGCCEARVWSWNARSRSGMWGGRRIDARRRPSKTGALSTGSRIFRAAVRGSASRATSGHLARRSRPSIWAQISSLSATPRSFITISPRDYGRTADLAPCRCQGRAPSCTAKGWGPSSWPT